MALTLTRKSSKGKSRFGTPTRITYAIVIAGFIVAVLVFFFVTAPSKERLQDEQDQNELALAQEAQNRQIAIDLKDPSRVFEGSELAAEVQPVEDLLPTVNETNPARPGDVVIDLQTLAEAGGLKVSNVTYPNGYSGVEGNEQLLKADVTMDVTGTRPAVFEYLKLLNQYPQLLAVQTTGVRGGADSSYSTSLTITVWATSAESWLGGRPGA